MSPVPTSLIVPTKVRTVHYGQVLCIQVKIGFLSTLLQSLLLDISLKIWHKWNNFLKFYSSEPFHLKNIFFQTILNIGVICINIYPKSAYLLIQRVLFLFCFFSFSLANKIPVTPPYYQYSIFPMFWISANLSAGYLYHIAVLICNSLVTNGIGKLFICLFAIYYLWASVCSSICPFLKWSFLMVDFFLCSRYH